MQWPLRMKLGQIDDALCGPTTLLRPISTSVLSSTWLVASSGADDRGFRRLFVGPIEQLVGDDLEIAVENRLARTDRRHGIPCVSRAPVVTSTIDPWLGILA